MEKILATALGQDVTELAVEEKRLLLSRLLSRLAHEIRNPLSSLDVHVQLLEEDLAEVPPRAKAKLAGRLHIIRGELHHLENVVKQFLRLAGPSALDLAPVEIGNVIGHVRALLEPDAGVRQIEIVSHIPEGLPRVVTDAGQITQALLNLALNALQAIEKNGRVELSARNAEGFLVIEVRDTGPGVPPEHLSMIFEPYFTTRPGGSGIGLWIAQQIIIAHGGTIQAANAPEGGAVFTARLPLRSGEKPDG